MQARPNCAIVAHCRPFLYPPPPALRAAGPQCPSLVIMVIVIRTTVITVVMMTIADAMIIRYMIRGFGVLTILSHSAKTLVYDC